MTNAPEEIPIKNWDDFCCSCNKLQGYESDSTDTVIFRGCQDAGWELIPSLYRKLIDKKVESQKIYDIEANLITAFKQKWFPAQMNSYINHTSLFQMLYIMQHYGIKTRMLDWTLSYLVAAYFATENNGGDDKDAAVWCVNKTQVEGQFQSICKKYKERSQCQGKRFLNEYNRCWDVTNENECPTKQLHNGQIRCNAIFFKDDLSIATDVRMTVQASYFTYCPNPLADHIKCITKVSEEETGNCCKKIIIPKGSKPEFREKLKQLTYTRKRLFPTINQDDNKKIFEQVLLKY